MKFIYVTEWEIGIGTQAEIPDDAYVIGKYSKQRMLSTIREFDDLKHDLPVYKFISPEGKLHEVLDIAQFARDNDLVSSRLHELMYKSQSRDHRGWKFIKSLEDTLVEK